MNLLMESEQTRSLLALASIMALGTFPGVIDLQGTSFRSGINQFGRLCDVFL